MNQTIWEKILSFDFDFPISEYGFSTRLSHENNWSINFTAEAIHEYRKFMYLAATEAGMISPSEIVDIVWHQHLIFTQSYSDFCGLLGKRIEHIPSTHNRDEEEKFRQAKENTFSAYNNIFGIQPEHIWHHDTMAEGLKLKPANTSMLTMIVITIIAFAFLIVPAYLLLYDFYAHLDSGSFIPAFILLSFIVFMLLDAFNKKKLKSLVPHWSEDLFLFKLEPSELVYIKHKQLCEVIHDKINKMIVQKKIFITDQNQISHTEYSDYKTPYEYCIIESLKSTGPINYPVLMQHLMRKPLFRSIENSMDVYLQVIKRSKVAASIQQINLISIGLLTLLGITRLFTGIMREKPIVFLIFLLFGLGCFILAFFRRLDYKMGSMILEDWYKENVISRIPIDENTDYRYFLVGSATLLATFIPMVTYAESTMGNRFGQSSIDASSGCGGSSCGGGGCGGGCGGCGGGD